MLLTHMMFKSMLLMSDCGAVGDDVDDAVGDGDEAYVWSCWCGCG